MANASYTTREDILPLISNFLANNNLPQTSSALKKELISQGINDKKPRISPGHTLLDILNRYSQVSSLFNLKAPRKAPAKKDVASSEEHSPVSTDAPAELNDNAAKQHEEQPVVSSTDNRQDGGNEQKDAAAAQQAKKQPKQSAAKSAAATKKAKADSATADSASVNIDLTDNATVVATVSPDTLPGGHTPKKNAKGTTGAASKGQVAVKKDAISVVKAASIPERVLSPSTFNKLNQIFERTGPQAMKELGIAYNPVSSVENLEKVAEKSDSDQLTAEDKQAKEPAALIAFHASEASSSEDSDSDSEDDRKKSTVKSPAKPKEQEKPTAQEKAESKQADQQGEIQESTKQVAKPLAATAHAPSTSTSKPFIPSFHLRTNNDSSDESSDSEGENSARKGTPLRLRTPLQKAPIANAKPNEEQAKVKLAAEKQVDSLKNVENVCKKKKKQPEKEANEAPMQEAPATDKPEKKKKKKKQKTDDSGDSQHEEDVLSSQEAKSAVAPLQSAVQSAAQESVVQESVVQESVVQESVVQEATAEEAAKEMRKEKRKKKKLKGKAEAGEPEAPPPAAAQEDEAPAVATVEEEQLKTEKKKKKKRKQAAEEEGGEKKDQEVISQQAEAQQPAGDKENEAPAVETVGEQPNTEKKKKKKRKHLAEGEEGEKKDEEEGEITSSQESMITSTQVPSKKKKKKLFAPDLSNLDLSPLLETEESEAVISSQDTTATDSQSELLNDSNLSLSTKKKKKKKKNLYSDKMSDITLEDIVAEVNSSQSSYTASPNNSLLVDPEKEPKKSKRAIMTDERTAWAGESVKYKKKKKTQQGQ